MTLLLPLNDILHYTIQNAQLLSLKLYTVIPTTFSTPHNNKSTKVKNVCPSPPSPCSTLPQTKIPRWLVKNPLPVLAMACDSVISYVAHNSKCVAKQPWQKATKDSCCGPTMKATTYMWPALYRAHNPNGGCNVVWSTEHGMCMHQGCVIRLMSHKIDSIKGETFWSWYCVCVCMACLQWNPGLVQIGSLRLCPSGYIPSIV